mgnify:CR=1 FL=1
MVIAIGRRKKAIAQVELVSGGTGEILINGKPAAEYMQGNSRFPKVIQGPLESLGLEEERNILLKNVDTIISDLSCNNPRKRPKNTSQSNSRGSQWPCYL